VVPARNIRANVRHFRQSGALHCLSGQVSALAYLLGLGLLHGLDVGGQLRIFIVLGLISLSGRWVVEALLAETWSLRSHERLALGFIVGSALLILLALPTLGRVNIHVPLLTMLVLSGLARQYVGRHKKSPDNQKCRREFSRFWICEWPMVASLISIPLAVANSELWPLVLTQSGFFVLSSRTQSTKKQNVLLAHGYMFATLLLQAVWQFGIKKMPFATSRYTLQSLDFHWWVAHSWSLIANGPFEDPLKPGYSLGYHFGAQLWSGALAVIAQVPFVETSGMIVVVFFGMSALVLLMAALRRSLGGPKGALPIVSAALLFGAVSPLEANSSMFAESNTQFVAVAFLVALIFVVFRCDGVLLRSSLVIIALLVAAYLAKVTSGLIALLVLASPALAKRHSSGRSGWNVVAVAGLGALLMVFLHWLYFLRHDDGYFGSIVLRVPSIDYLWSYVGGADSTPFFMKIGLILVYVLVLCLLVTAAIRHHFRFRNDLSALVVTLGGVILFAAFVTFPPEGSGEKYLFSTALLVLLVIVIGLCGVGNDKADNSRYPSFLPIVMFWTAVVVGWFGWRMRLVGWPSQSTFPAALLLIFAFIGGASLVTGQYKSCYKGRRRKSGLTSFARSLLFALALVHLGFALAYGSRSLILQSPTSQILRAQSAESQDPGALIYAQIQRQTAVESIVLAPVELQLGVLSYSERRLFIFEEMPDKYPAGSPIGVSLRRRRTLQQRLIYDERCPSADSLPTNGTFLIVKPVHPTRVDGCSTLLLSVAGANGRQYELHRLTPK
jgi:hypothetical protein